MNTPQGVGFVRIHKWTAQQLDGKKLVWIVSHGARKNEAVLGTLSAKPYEDGMILTAILRPGSEEALTQEQADSLEQLFCLP